MEEQARTLVKRGDPVLFIDVRGKRRNIGQAQATAAARTPEQQQQQQQEQQRGRRRRRRRRGG